jgi:hypothetical protein
MTQKRSPLITRARPEGGPWGSLGSAVRWNSASNQSEHHSPVFQESEPIWREGVDGGKFRQIRHRRFCSNLPRAVYFHSASVGRRRQGREYGYIDERGHYVCCLADEKTGKYGYIDKTWKIVVNPQFDETEGFTSDGLAVMKIAGQNTATSHVSKSGCMASQNWGHQSAETGQRNSSFINR